MQAKTKWLIAALIVLTGLVGTESARAAERPMLSSGEARQYVTRFLKEGVRTGWSRSYGIQSQGRTGRHAFLFWISEHGTEPWEGSGEGTFTYRVEVRLWAKWVQIAWPDVRPEVLVAYRT